MPRHVVVDGSNIATEGRPMPSLKQLNDAVLSYLEEHPTEIITVVVDATFGHRIDPSEVAAFDDAVDNNELVAPPAGAIGRGDAFVLSIAAKAGATILSNDSFQEFHGEHPWLFDEGRLVGGKPVPNVGWVFVPRAPVRGPISRRAQRDARHGKAARAGELLRTPSSRPGKMASEPLPAPKTPPPGASRRRGRGKAAAEAPAATPASAAPVAQEPVGITADRVEGARPLPSRNEPINELLSFLDFVGHHPVGSMIEAVVEQYSSHGAYVDAAGVRCYIPLRYMGDPPPRSARTALKPGEKREFVVVSFNPARRGIDVALPAGVPAGVTIRPLGPAEPEAAKPAPAKRARKARKAPARAEPIEPLVEAAPEAVTAVEVAAATGIEREATPVEPVPVKKAAAKKGAKKAPAKAVAKKAAATQPAPAKRAAAKKAAAKKAAPVKKAAPAKKAAAKKAPAKKAPAKKAAAKKLAAKGAALPPAEAVTRE